MMDAILLHLLRGVRDTEEVANYQIWPVKTSDFHIALLACDRLEELEYTVVRNAG